MPILAFVGDIHGHSDDIYPYLVEWTKRTGVSIDAVVQVGDYCCFWNVNEDEKRRCHFARHWFERTGVPIPTYVLPGNHEDITVLQAWQKHPEQIFNLHLLPDGGVTDICGIQIGTVWGNYSPRSWLHPERVALAREQGHLLNRKRQAMHILRPSVDTLLEYPGKIDVMVTHDAPTCAIPLGFLGRVITDPAIKELLGLDSDETNQGCPGFSQLIHKYHPKLYFFGHFHVRDDRDVDDTHVTCLHAFDFNPEQAVDIISF